MDNDDDPEPFENDDEPSDEASDESTKTVRLVRVQLLFALNHINLKSQNF